MKKTKCRKWRRRIAFVLSLALMFTMLPDAWLGTVAEAAQAREGEEVALEGENVALKATAGADYSNTGTDPKNVNNGYLATDASTTWNTWKKDGAVYPAPIWLEWKVSQELDGMRVVWWADNANISGSDSVTFPKSCTVEYLNDQGQWQKITGMTNESNGTVDQVGVLYNSSDGNGLNGANKQWNTVKFANKIKTKKLRLLIERSGTDKNGVGISEWEVYGSQAPDAGNEQVNIAGEATVEAEYSNTSTSTANVNDGQLAIGSNTTWNTWCKDANLTYPYPIVMKWKKQRTLSGMKVMWWADDAEPGTTSGDGVLYPKSCEVQYWDGEKWETITGMTDEAGKQTDTVGVKYGSEQAAVSPDDGQGAKDYLQGNNRYWNEVRFGTQIKTDQIRLLVSKPDGADQKSGIGIGEWEVYGNYQEDIIVTGKNIAPEAKASADYSNTDTSPDKVNNMELGGDSKTSWNTWKNAGDLTYPQPITLTWEKPYDLSSMRVMWWADDAEPGTASGDGVVYPKDCQVWYFDYETNDWKQITSMENESGDAVSGVGVKQNGTQGKNRTWNGVAFEKSVKTTKLQLRINRPDNTSSKGGIGISEWEVFGKEVTDEFVGAQITGKKQLLKSETSVYYAQSIPSGVSGTFTYEWTVPEESKNMIQIDGANNQETVSVKALAKGTAVINLKMTAGEIVRQASYEVNIDEIADIDEYETTTTPGKAPILPDSVVVNGITFDDPTPSLKSTTKDYDFAETFDSKLMPVTWNTDGLEEKIKNSKVGDTFTVEGTVANTTEKATAKVTVKKAAEAAVENSTVTFENVELTDEFWLPKQKVNALNSLNAAIYRIGLASGGEPNFDNAIKKLNGEPYEPFSGLVFQDTDIYKTLEAISYTLSVIKDEKDDAEIIAQKTKLEEVLERWITKIEKVQYADGYINTHFTLRSQGYEGGRAPGTHRWRNMSNHEMYVAGHFLEGVVAYTRYREGIGDPDYRLYVAGRRFADHIVNLFGPNGTRHEVPGHEEVELALVKFAKLVEEYEGEGAGDKYVDTAKTLIDRRGEDYKLRESGYQGYQDGKREYSQDAKPFTEETNAVGHAVRATYLYTGATDVARLLPEDDPDKEAYLNILDTIWDSVANKKTYITGGIGVASHGEDFGGDYELPNNDSYNEICASIALTNWNQRMNLVHEDAKYADVMERALYNGILVGTNLEGNKFYYANKLEIPKKGGSTDGGMYGGVQRQDWFTCACCPPNLMRTIAKLSEYMYTTHGDKVFVNLYVGSDGNINVDGTKVNLVQNTKYPWEGSVGITVTPEKAKTFTMNIRIPSWVKEQDNRNVSIKVVSGGKEEAIDAVEEKGYVAITREWKQGDVIRIDMPMEIRKTEANPNVTTNQGKVAIERGPIVYALEKAGNAQLNSGTVNESDFDPRNYVIPRESELTASYKESLLKGVVEITGNVKYKKSDTETVDVKLQAVPFYASNNRGDTNEYKPDGKSTRMTVWTNASGTATVKRTLTLDANGGTLSETTLKITDGQKIGSLPKPERKYFKFLGWFTAKEGGTEVTTETVVTEDMTIYARWEKDLDITIYTVTLDANGGKVSKVSIDQESGQKVGTLPTPTKTGSKFLGWFTAKEGGTEITKDTIVDKDFTAYARWEDPDVVFGASGGQENLGISDVYLIATNEAPSPEGNDKSAAYIEGETATGGNKLGSTRIGCLVFKLQDAWKALDSDKISATVTINVADINHELGASKTKAGLFAVDQELTDIDLTNAASYPAKNNDYSKTATVYSKEWISASELGKKTFDVTEIVRELLKNKNATHAIFRLQTVTSGFLVSNKGENAPTLTVEEKSEITTHTVTLDANGGEVTTTSIQKEAGEKIGTLPEPTKAGFKFLGWYTAKEGGEKVTEDTIVTKNMTIYAQWEEKTVPEPSIKDDGKGNYEVTIPNYTPGQDETISIPLPSSLADNIKNSQEAQVSIHVKLPEGLADDQVEAITIPKEVLSAAKEAEKDLTVAVNGSTSYQWTFSAKDLADVEVSDLNLALEIDSEKDAEIKNLLGKDDTGMVLSFAQQGDIKGAKVLVDAAKMGWKPGETVTLSFYNPQTKKLETAGTYKVGNDGKVAIAPAKGGKYVLWKRAASGTTIPVEKVTLNKKKLTLNVKKTYQLKATVTPTNATNRKVTWSSDNKSVATVTANGLVTAKKVGKAKITAKAGGKSVTCTVTVKIPVSKVTLNKTKLTMGVKESFTLKATVKPNNATNKKVSWKTSNKKIVTVKNGKLTAKKKGKATITATVDGKKVTCKVTVKPAPTKKTKVTLNKKKVTLKVKKTFQIKPKVSTKYGSATFKYTIDKKGKKAVKVDKNGKVTAKKKGKATITVKTYNGKAKAILKVTVK